MFSLTDFLKLLKCRLLLAADMKLNTGKCFLFGKIPVFQHQHISMEAPNSVFTTSVNEDIKNLWTKVQHSVLLFAPLLRRSIVQESSSVRSEVAVIACLVECSFLQMRRPWCLFLCFSQNGKSATKAICCFYKGKQWSENGCTFFFFPRCSIKCLWPSAFEIFMFVMHIMFTFEVRETGSKNNTSSYSMGHWFFHESLEKLVPNWAQTWGCRHKEQQPCPPTVHQSPKGDVETLSWHTGWKLLVQPSDLRLTSTW